jgi:L-ribulose-5-phosphate 3-epimerase
VPGVARNGVTYQECWDRSLAEIRRAIPVARDLGVKIAIENVGNDFILQPQQAVDYLDALNSEWVGWHFDIGNAGRYGPAENWIKALGKRIVRIHIKDYSAKPVDPSAKKSAARPKLLEGDTHWPAVMAALDQAGYSGWAITEQPGDQANSVATARDLVQRMDRIFAA